MKTIFKTLLVIIFLCVISYRSISQPAKGIKVGANYTLYKNANDISYSALQGFQLGYAWSTKLNDALALSIEGLLTNKASNVKYKNEEYMVDIDEKRNATYMSAPVGLNYCLPKFYAGAGYEFAYMVAGNLPVNVMDHSLFLQSAYKISFINIALKYGTTLNKEKGGTFISGGNYEGYEDINSQPTATYTPKSNILQLSLIFNLGRK
jgi:hypothetical protein